MARLSRGITRKNTQQVIRQIYKQNRELIGEAGEISNQVCNEVVARITKDAPIKTGQLVANIKSQQWNNRLAFRISVNVPYANYAEYGTKPHVIRPKNYRVLKFYWDKAGTTIYTTKVNHPGGSGRHFFSDNATWGQNELRKRLKALIKSKGGK